MSGFGSGEAVVITSGRIRKSVDSWNDLANIRVMCYVCHQSRLDEGEELSEIHELVRGERCLSWIEVPSWLSGSHERCFPAWWRGCHLVDVVFACPAGPRVSVHQ
jgi:hypothetical protein